MARDEGVPSGGGGPSSYELIDAALRSGAINQDTAYKYQVFAVFNDSRLPSQYRGTDAETGEHMDLLDAVGGALATLSPQTRADLEPFFTRPDEPGSWITLDSVPTQGGPGSQIASAASASAASVTWTTFGAVGGKAKVWAQDRYPGDAAKAEAIATALAEIWRTESELMGTKDKPPEPVSDRDMANNGGGGALDVYLVHAPLDVQNRKGWRGNAPPTVPNEHCLTSRYLLIDSNEPLGSATSPGMLQTVAHELFHAIQFSFPLKTGCWQPEYGWFFEASATWVEDYVYPKAQSEQVMAQRFLRAFPEESLDLWDLTGHQNAAYLFPFYLARTGNPTIVRSIFRAFATRTSLAAIDEVIGTFDQVFPRFANLNWNRDPVDDYKKWDNLKDEPFPFGGSVELGLEKLKIHLGIPYLSARYRQFTFKDDVEKVIFENTIAQEGISHAGVWGITKANGRWEKPADWTHVSRKEWCRNEPSDLEELVIVFSDSDWQGKNKLEPSEQPTVEGRAAGCNGWRGKATAKVQMGSLVEPGLDWSFTLNSTADILWELDENNSPCVQDPEGACNYRPTGTISWTYEYNLHPPSGGIQCKESGSGSVPAGKFVRNWTEQWLALVPDALGGYRYFAVGDSGHTFYPDHYCKGLAPFGDWPDLIYIMAAAPPAGDYRIAPGAHSFSGSFHRGLGDNWDGSYDWTWEFQEVGKATP